MTVLLSQEDLLQDSNFQPEQTESFDGTWEDTEGQVHTKDPVALQAYEDEKDKLSETPTNVLLSQEDLEQYGGVDKTQTTAHIDETTDPLFKDDEVSMGTEFAYGFQKMPTDVENLSIYLEAKYPMPGWTSSHTRPDTEDSSFFKSVEELYGEDFTSLSEDARRDRIQQYRQDYLSREYPVLSKKEEQQDSKYDKSWSEATGSFLGMLATPTVAVPIGQTYKAAAGIGALLGFSYGVTEGLAEEGEVDWTTTGQYTGGGALLSPLMIWGGRQFATRYKTAMAGQQIKKQTKAANELLNTYDSLVYEAVHKGETNPTVIFKKLNQMLGITNDELTRAAKLAERKIHIPTQKEATLYFETIEHTAGIATKKGGAIDEYLGVLSTRIKNMNVPIWHRLRKLEYNQHARLHTNYTEVAPFLDGLSKVKGPAKNALILSLYNGKVKQVEALLKKQGNTELLAAFRATQKTLNKLHTEATDAGLTLGYKENYFPRVVKDIDGIQKHFGKDKRDEILEMIDAAAIAKGAQLSKAEQADVINQYLVGKRYFVGNKFTAFNKERKIETVTPELLKFYENPEQALHTYIRRVVSETEKKKFFGNAWEKGGLDSTDIDESIGRLLVEEKRLGNVQIGDTTELGRLLQLRFGPGEQGPAKWIQASKSMLYAQTLGNPISAVTQLGDIFLSSYKNGIKPTVQALLSKKKIKLEDYGFTDIAEEFASKTATAGFMRKTFKWGGFSRVDRLGKEVLLNSSFLKYTKEVSTPVGMKAFRKKWRKAFGDDINELAENLRAGNSDNEQVRLLLWHDLSDMQPISLSEMPAKYLSSPDGRALYMLKTFTIKQFDIMRRDAFKLLANKETRAEGVKNLIKYATIFTAGNMTSDSIKSWMLGRDYDIEDSALNSIWRLAGLSKYSGEKLGDKPLDVTWDLAKPPLNIWGDMLSAAQDALDFDSETEASNKWVKGIPVVGKPMYEHFLGGKEEYAEKADKKRRGFRRGGIVAQAERLGFNKGGEVSLDNTSNSLISKESQILVDNETVPFVDRIINPQDYPYPEDNKDGSISTHLLSVEVDEDGSAYVFPTKVYQDKGYKTYTNDERFKALDDAKSSGNTIKFDTIDEAVNFSKNYKTENFKKYYRRKPLVDDMEDNIDTVLTTPSDIGDAWGKRALMMQDTFKRARNNEINALLFAGHIAGDIAGGVWDTMGEAGEAVIDTARVNARYSFPDVYESLANKLSDDGKKLLDTTIVKKGLKKAGDLFTWYRDDFKKNNPIEAKSLEATGNLLPLAFLKPLLKKTGTLNNQMDDVLEGEVLPPVSTYKYKSNSDTPHLDVRNTERYQYLGNATTTKINEVNKFFNPDVLNKALQGTDKNTKVVYMLPGNFLTLAKTHTSGVETKKLDRINKAIDENIQLEDIPTLTIKAGTGGGSQVIKHDGRHRVNALENLGLDLIPVRIIIEGNTSGKRIETVTNEDGLEVYSFPNASVYNRTHYGEAAIIQQADKLFKNIVVEDSDTSILIGSKEKASNGLPSAYIELDKTGEWNTWVVNDVMVEGKYLNQKVGKRMYLRAIEEALENKVDYIDSDGLMSSDSIRVWEGLKMTSPREIERLGFGHLNGMFTVRGSTAGNIEHKEKKGGSTYEQAEDDAMFQIELNSALYHDKKPKAAMPAKKTKEVRDNEFKELAKGLTESGGFKYKLPTMLLDLALKDKVGLSKPKQWKYSLSQWAKKGKIKQEELDDSMLMKWLDTIDVDGKLSTKDIFNFMRDNSPMLKTYTSKIQSKVDTEWLDKQPLQQEKIKLQDNAHNKFQEVIYLRDLSNITDISSDNKKLVKTTAEMMHHAIVENIINYMHSPSFIDNQLMDFLTNSPYTLKAIQRKAVDANLLNKPNSIFHPDHQQLDNKEYIREAAVELVSEVTPDKRNSYIVGAIIEDLNQAYLKAEGREKEVLSKYVNIFMDSYKAKIKQIRFGIENVTELRKLSEEALRRNAGDVNPSTWSSFSLPNMKGKPVTILVQSKVGTDDRLKKLRDFRAEVSEHSKGPYIGHSSELSITGLTTKLNDPTTLPLSAKERIETVRKLKRSKQTFKEKTGVTWEDRQTYLDNLEGNIYTEEHWTGTYGESPLKKGIPQENIIISIRGNVIEQGSLGESRGLFISEQQAQPHQTAMANKKQLDVLGNNLFKNITGYSALDSGAKIKELQRKLKSSEARKRAISGKYRKLQKDYSERYEELEGQARASILAEVKRDGYELTEQELATEVAIRVWRVVDNNYNMYDPKLKSINNQQEYNIKVASKLNDQEADIAIQIRQLTNSLGTMFNALPENLSHKKDWTPLAMKQSIKYAIDNNLNYLVLPIEKHSIQQIEQWGDREPAVLTAILDRNSIYSPRAYRDIVKKWDKDAKPFNDEYLDRDERGDWTEADIHKVIVLPITDAIRAGYKKDGLTAYRRGGLVTQMKALIPNG